MARLQLPSREQAPAETHATLDGFGHMLGFIPNGIRLLSLSPIALQAFVGLQGTLAKALSAKIREAIALAVSQANGCSYCIAIHSFVGDKFSKTPSDELTRNLQGESSDPQKAAAASFAKRLVETRGKVSDEDLAGVRAAGFTDREIVEIIALTIQFTMTNFMNNVAITDIDIPAVAGM